MRLSSAWGVTQSGTVERDVPCGNSPDVDERPLSVTLELSLRCGRFSPPCPPTASHPSVAKDLNASFAPTAHARTRPGGHLMADESAQSAGLRDRIARGGEDALGKLAQELLENPLVNSAIAKAFEARERAAQAQETAMGALNIPSAADIERLTRRLRSVSQRMEGIEEAVDRLDQRLAGMANAQVAGTLDERLSALDNRLSTLALEISNLASALDAGPAPLPREQERLKVDEPTPTPARRRTTKKTS